MISFRFKIRFLTLHQRLDGCLSLDKYNSEKIVSMIGWMHIVMKHFFIFHCTLDAIT